MSKLDHEATRTNIVAADTGTVMFSEAVQPMNRIIFEMRMRRPMSLCPRLGPSWSNLRSASQQEIDGPACNTMFENLCSNLAIGHFCPSLIGQSFFVP